MKLINVLVLLTLILLSNAAYGQDLDNPLLSEHFMLNHQQMMEKEYKIPKKHREHVLGELEALKNGVLIFRLKTNDKALKKLEGILNNPNTKESSKKRIRESTIPDLKASAAKQNDKLIRAFAEGYDFSAVYFMPDTCTNTLQKNYPLTCLTDVEGNPVSADILVDKSIFLADFSELENDTTTRIKGLIISDKNANRLTPPFPYFQRSGGVLVKLSSNTITPKDALKMVERWNKKLHDFHKQR